MHLYYNLPTLRSIETMNYKQCVVYRARERKKKKITHSCIVQKIYIKLWLLF